MAFPSVFAKANGFISSSPQRSDSSHNSPTHKELRRQPESGSVSPTKRCTEKWLQEHTPNKHGGGLDLRKVKEGRVVRKKGREQRKKRASFWNLALWFGGSGKSRSNDGEEDDDDLEGDTMIDDDDDDDDGSAAAPGHDNDLTMVVDDHDEGTKGDETAHALRSYSYRYLGRDDPRIQDWTEAERWLFAKLVDRGYEPLLHTTWILDYPTFPDQLFTNDPSKVYISNIHGSIGRGTHYSFASSCLLSS